VELEYSHTLEVGGLTAKEFKVPAHPAALPYRLQLAGVGASPTTYVIGETPYRLEGELIGDTLELVLPYPNGPAYSKVVLDDEASVFSPGLERVTESGFFTDYTALTPDSAFIIVTHPSLMSAAQTYAVYRTNQSRDAVVVDVEELYDQFGAGIPKHFHAIRRFCSMALETWPSRPAQLFLIGKSVYFEVQSNIIGTRKTEEHYSKCLVPSYGSPGSDLLFTRGLEEEGIVPSIPTGRLSAKNAQEVLDYLGKVVFNESREPAAWMKNVLHFGGGNTEAEQTLFANYLSNYEAVIEDTCFGGDVSTFLKESSLPIVVNLSDSISDIISEGLSIITFFGHAGGGQFDQSIDEPANLEWGAHPMVIVNSCYSGDIHQLEAVSTSEQYVVLPEKGAIGFLATIKQGLEGFLNAYSQELYRQISYKNYGMPMGHLMKETISAIGGDFQQRELRNSILMNTLQGDPAVRIFSPQRPDYELLQSSVSFDPAEVTAVVDSFDVVIALTNIGKATNEPFSVEMVRTRPDGVQSVHTELMESLYFRDTVRFRVPTDFGQSFGLNTFDIQVDLPNNVVNEEDDFFNNRVSRELLISDGGVFPVYPYEYAIIPDDQVTLKASTGNPFIDTRGFSFQMDTVDTFDSPMLNQYSLEQSGGVLNWDVPMTLTDSTVYYWRVSEDVVDESERQWKESSFQYIQDRIGWGQAHYYQFKKNRYNNLIYDRPDRDFDFFSGEKSIKVEVFGDSFEPGQNSEYFIDFLSVEYDGCGLNEAYHVAVIDPVTLEPWETSYGGENPENDFGNLNNEGQCRNRTERYFIFRQINQGEMDGFRNLIQNVVPDGHIVVIYTWLHTRPDLWPENLPDHAAIFEDLGAEGIAAIDEPLPFIFIGKKGSPETALEVVGDTIDSFITAEYMADVFGNTGLMTSPTIGPATGWDALFWEASEVDITDSVRVKIIGLTPGGVAEQIQGGDFILSQGEATDLEELIDAQVYPRIQLQLFQEDEEGLDPVHWNRWQLLYDPVPEAALNPYLGLVSEGDSIQEGQDYSFATAIENISAWDMDSVLVNYWIQTSSNERFDIPYPRQDSLRSGEFLLDTLEIETLGLEGTNSLWIEVNPRIGSNGEQDQLEQYYFNNLAQLRFHVAQDRVNPILDVTFDGRHILDGEMVSAEPRITMRLDDENPFLLMDDPADTSFFSIFLKEPNGFQRRVRFLESEQESMRFLPADDSRNISEIQFEPRLPQDGRYSLLVIASDKSGNASGSVDYRISFEVEQESSITEVLNYPNPFTTNTRFVFTLTGSQVPDYMKIQIMTITGRVVKEIFKEELGPIHIGKNITEYAWDGTDMYGDRLANGVYLYRVITRDSGADLEIRETAASTFFKKGFGKMYLMR
jgi:hypothetical protein